MSGSQGTMQWGEPRLTAIKERGLASGECHKMLPKCPPMLPRPDPPPALSRCHPGPVFVTRLVSIIVMTGAESVHDLSGQHTAAMQHSIAPPSWSVSVNTVWAVRDGEQARNGGTTIQSISARAANERSVKFSQSRRRPLSKTLC